MTFLAKIYENIWQIFLKKYATYKMSNIKSIQQADITFPKVSSSTVRYITNIITPYIWRWLFSLNCYSIRENENNLVEFLKNKFIRLKNTSFTDKIVTNRNSTDLHIVFQNFYENDASKKLHSGYWNHYQYIKNFYHKNADTMFNVTVRK